MMTEDFEYVGDWLDVLTDLDLDTPISSSDDAKTLHLGYMLSGVVHQVSQVKAMQVQEWFRTEEQRDRVLRVLGLELEELRKLLQTPAGRCRIYGIKEG